MEIKEKLDEMYKKPYKDGYKRRIVFWNDENAEFKESVSELCPDGVRLLVLSGDNNFYAKKTLLKDDTESDYLVYNPIAYDKAEDNWLYDIEQYSEHFSADAVSMRLKELDINENDPRFRKAIKLYSKFFENKERTAKFKALGSEYTDVPALHIDILSVLTSAKKNTFWEVMKAVLTGDDDLSENTAVQNIKKFGNYDVFCQMVEKYTGYKIEDDSTALDISQSILITALSATMAQKNLVGLEEYISIPAQSLCFSFINEWLHGEDDGELYDICRDVEERLNLNDRFLRLDVQELLSSECFPCINECILEKLMTGIVNNDFVKVESVLNIVEKRRTQKWYKRVRCYFDCLFYLAEMQEFYRQHADGFHTGKYETLFRNYCEEYYLMDTYYRHFQVNFSNARKKSTVSLEDLLISVADYAEKLYKNWYLKELGAQWNLLTQDEFTDGAYLGLLSNQMYFYNKYVDSVAAGSRVYVIISDAFRYEIAAQLCGELTAETKGTATIDGLQGIFPSVTKYGMAALLPHNILSLDDKLKVYCDGMPTDTTENRIRVLQCRKKQSTAIRYNDFIDMKIDERREAVNGMSVVYIYHNIIDATGENAATEGNVFDACGDAIEQLKNLVRTITTSLSGSNIFITADHGFLYSRKPLDESTKITAEAVNGNVLEIDRRHLISDDTASSDYLVKIPLTDLSSKLTGFAPKEDVRLKTQGGGLNYVHGGISLQEIAIPVISFKNFRKSSKNYVEVTQADIELIDTGRKITNSIFTLRFLQTSAVGGKCVAGVYDVYVADASGRHISDVQKIIADKTESSAADRVIKTKLTLKGFEFDRQEFYYLTIKNESGNTAPKQYEYQIDIAFTNDFDF